MILFLTFWWLIDKFFHRKEMIYFKDFFTILPRLSVRTCLFVLKWERGARFGPWMRASRQQLHLTVVCLFDHQEIIENVKKYVKLTLSRRNFLTKGRNKLQNHSTSVKPKCRQASFLYLACDSSKPFLEFPSSHSDFTWNQFLRVFNL